jgi:hypothetical protein
MTARAMVAEAERIKGCARRLFRDRTHLDNKDD